MWSSWAFCKLVHISMPTPCLSINTCQLNTFEIGTGKSPCLVVSKAAIPVGRDKARYCFGFSKPVVAAAGPIWSFFGPSN